MTTIAGKRFVEKGGKVGGTAFRIAEGGVESRREGGRQLIR